MGTTSNVSMETWATAGTALGQLFGGILAGRKNRQGGGTMTEEQARANLQAELARVAEEKRKKKSRNTVFLIGGSIVVATAIVYVIHKSTQKAK